MLQEPPEVNPANSQVVPPADAVTSVMVQVNASVALVLDRAMVCCAGDDPVAVANEIAAGVATNRGLVLTTTVTGITTFDTATPVAAFLPVIVIEAWHVPAARLLVATLTAIGLALPVVPVTAPAELFSRSHPVPQSVVDGVAV